MLMRDAAHGAAGVGGAIARCYKPFSFVIAGAIIWALLHAKVVAAAQRRSVLAFYTLAAGVMCVLAFGPTPTAFGVRFFYKAPYAWLMVAPGFNGSFRSPARFGMLLALCLSVAAGVAWAAISRRWPRHRARWVTAAVLAVILAEGWAPLDVAAAPGRIGWPAQCAGLPRLELPVGDPVRDAAAQYRALLDRTRSVNGLSGFMPKPSVKIIVATRTRDGQVFRALADRGPLCVAVHRRDPDGPDLAAWVSASPLARELQDDTELAFFLIGP
jgi:hypothetical protein